MVARKKASVWRSAAARRLLRLATGAATVEEAVATVAGAMLEGISYPPIVLEDLFAKLNVSELRTEDDLPFSGELRPENGRFAIVCSKDLSTTRRRFTIAHELAHAIFELSGPKCPRSGRELERLCDMIATELLMPRGAFAERAGEDPGVDQVFELANIFRTSLTATAIRFNELFKLSVFATEADVVVWGNGAIKKGSIRYLDSALQRLIREAGTSCRGAEVLPLEIRGSVLIWSVQYRRIKKDQTLFVLQPPSKELADDSALESPWFTPALTR